MAQGVYAGCFNYSKGGMLGEGIEPSVTFESSCWSTNSKLNGLTEKAKHEFGGHEIGEPSDQA